MMPAAPRPEICVFHLIWAPLGLDPFREFLASYRDHPAGIPHRLRLLFNGFGSGAEALPYLELLDGTEAEPLFIGSPIQDIPAYFRGAGADDATFACFLNSHTRILDPGWLAKLHGQASRPGVGLVGTTGSFESFSSAVRREPFERPRLWRRRPLHIYRFARAWLDQSEDRRRRLKAAKAEYRTFPNPHIRTGAFMLRRELMLALEAGPIETKEQAWAFESGRRGLTAQVLARGLEVLVVGRDGRGYPIAEADSSGTFRIGDQDNLLISDNRTRDFDRADPETRRYLAGLAWGEAGSVRTAQR